MDLVRTLEEYFHDLDSKLICKRKKACDELLGLIEQQRTIEKLKNDLHIWQKMFIAIQNCLKKEGERRMEEIKKKGQISNNNHPITELFPIFIKKSIEHNIHFDIGKMIDFVLKMLENDVCKRCYEQVFLKLLLDYFLSSQQMLCLFPIKIWTDLYRFLKSSIITTVEANYLQCISIIIKRGPKYNFPVHLLRDEYDFIEDLCKKITRTSKRSHQEIVVGIAYEFMLFTAKDCRKACCKLGEEILDNFIELYEFNGGQDQLKKQLIQLFLLQINIHHPYGSLRNNSLSFAVDWSKWLNYLPSIFNLIVKEIDRNSNLKYKNPSIFLTRNQTVILLDSFVELFVEVTHQIILNNIQPTSLMLEPAQKRQKTIIYSKIDYLIERVQETKFWPWIDLTMSQIKKYPDIITDEALMNLFTILTNLQIESSTDTDLKYYLCKSFCILANLDNNDNNRDWNTIIKSVLGSISTHQNDKYVQELLQIWIKKNYIGQYEGLLQNYKINILKASESSLATLHLIFVNYVNTNNSKNSNQTVIRKDLIVWIVENLKSSNTRTLVDLGEFLVCLLTKQWPRIQKTTHLNDENANNSILNELREIQEIYMKISLEKYLTPPICEVSQIACNNTDFNNCLDVELYDFLLDQIRTNIDLSNIDNLLNFVIFFHTTLSYLIEFNLIVINEEDDIFKLFETNVSQLLETIPNDLSLDNERDLNLLYKNIEKLKDLFNINTNSLMTTKLRDLCSENFLRFLFNILEIEHNTSDIHEDVIVVDRGMNINKLLKLSTIEILGSYCFNSNTNNLSDYQLRAILAILQRNYDLSDTVDYEMIMAFLQCFCKSSVDDIYKDILPFLYNQISSICEHYYQSSMNSIEILQVFERIYRFFIGKTSLQMEMITALEIFYNEQKIYNPNVIIALIKSMNIVYKSSPNSHLVRWQNNQEIILKIPEFLNNNSVDVRFHTIEIIGEFFQISSKFNNLDNYHRQELMFAKIQNVIDEIFNLELSSSTATDEIRLTDETTTRIATVLQTYSTIVINSNLWLQEALFELIVIANKRRFSNELLITTIEKLAKHFGYKNRVDFLDKYIKNLYEKWNQSQPPLGEFPYFLFVNQQSKDKFYKKYYKKLTLILEEPNIFDKLMQLLEISTKDEIYHEIFSQLVTKIVINQDTSSEILQNTKLFWEKFDEIFINLLEYLYDEKDFFRRFKKRIYFTKFPSKQITIEQFKNCLRYLDNYYQQSIIENLLKNHPLHVHRILLNLKILIYNNVDSAIEEKYRYFHQFTIIVEIFIEHLKKNHQISNYLLTNIINYLLNLIRTKKELQQLSCRYLKKIIESIYPEYVEILQIYFPIIVSKLKTFQSDLEIDGDGECVKEILQFFLIDNKQTFIDSIFYQDELEKLEFSVQIDEFLKFYKKVAYFDIDNLKYLRKLLIKNKTKFLTNLELLQQLICILIKIICTTTNDLIRTESMRCLGELGPINLQKLILQSENPLENIELNINELILGHLLSLLSNYQFDDNNPYLIEHISNCLYELTQSRDAKKLIDNKNDFGYGALNPNNLSPFLSLNERNSNKRFSFLNNIDVQLFETSVNSTELWLKSNKHQDWILNLCTTILQTCRCSQFYSSLIEICKLKLEFIEALLPLVILTLIVNNSKRICAIVCERIGEFFENHWKIAENNQDNCGYITINEQSIKCMLNVVNFVRLETKSRSISKNLELNYLHVAKAASYCSIHFQALFYAELWCQQQLDDFYDFNITKLDFIYERIDQIKGRVLHDILKRAYKSIGEVDALLGCGTSFLLEPNIRIEYYKELNKWQQITHYYNLGLLTNPQQNNEFITSLKNCNLYETVLCCCPKLEQIDFESLWRLGQWNFPINDNIIDDNCEKCKFFTLKSINDNNLNDFKKYIENYRETILKQLCRIDLGESCHNYYNTVTQLQSMIEIEDFTDVIINNNENIDDLLNKWFEHLKVLKNHNNFEYIEPIQQQRFILLKQLNREFNDLMIEMQLDFIEYTRLEKNYLSCERLLKDIDLSNKLSENYKIRVKIERAQLLWKNQDYLTANVLLKQLTADIENIDPKLHAVILKIQGKWFVDSFTENRETIINDYFLKSLELFENCTCEKDLDSIIDIYENLSKFTDYQYQQIMEHLKSDVYQKKLDNMEKTKIKLSTMKKQLNNLSKELKKNYLLTERFNKIDETEINNIEKEKNSLLELALKYYLLNLSSSDKHNICIYRIVSLLLENRKNSKIKEIIETNLPKIPKYKFITILPQIIPHIAATTNEDWVTKLIRNIIEKCSLEHPYHTTQFLLSLVYADKDENYLSKSTATTSKQINDNSTKLRADAARKILQKIIDKTNKEFVKKMEHLWDALMELAYYEPRKYKDETQYQMPKTLKLLKMKHLNEIPVLSQQITINKSGKYHNIIGISTYNSVFSTVGGITGPKRITCYGTNGRKYNQLLKKQDDLRQDAVMQQVFTIINDLLSINKETKNLQIRTYKVVPLSRRSGIVEWVDNSLKLADYLNDAHVKYRPYDYKPDYCRQKYSRLPPDDVQKRLQIFKNICENFKPILHKFFETNYLQPTVWYEKRRNYIHSVATTSITGYILGVGDRHVCNILIDEQTAEVIHIDFGIAFEQGRVLPTPETVPFRLTRDIIDGMGVSGCEGLYRRSCEKTLKLLRENYQTILTILEVLLYDPLYDWSLSISDLKKRQRDQSSDNDDCDYDVVDGNTSDFDKNSLTDGDNNKNNEINTTAERALLRLKEKLLGMENGNPISVEHQVSILIQQAMDPFNLCRLYQGWQPFL